MKLLDVDSREAWEVKLDSSTACPTFSQFEDFVIGRTQAIQNLFLNHPTAFGNKEHSSRHGTAQRHGGAVHIGFSASTTNFPGCPLCSLSHHLSSCPTFQSKNTNQRYELVSQHRRCFNCLGNHSLQLCRSTRRCLKCGKQHHTSIHPGKINPIQGSKMAATSQAEVHEVYVDESTTPTIE